VKGEAVVIIPARYGSVRLPGKPLLPIAGKPLVMHVVERAAAARLVKRVIVATDDDRIADSVRAHGAESILTSPTARSGTDRVAEALATLDVEIVVNVQGDEPLIDPGTIDAAIRPLLDEPSLQMSTTAEPITAVDDVLNPNVVKVVTDSQGFALLFSRSPIPHIRTTGQAQLESTLRDNQELLSHYRKHTGLYVYRRPFLKRFVSMETSSLEKLEALEQLRALENGYKIRVVNVTQRSIGVDTRQDYERVKKLIEERST
jgi:3-deoxy-manno-octulosonate cytidylyltransferase (CMP-KDO synthetase)